MKLFPTKDYRIEFNSESCKPLELLKIQTLESDVLASQLTTKWFVGTVNDDNFRIIGSEIGIGAFVVFEGKINKAHVEISTQVNKPFKILISIIAAFGLFGFFVGVFRNGVTNSFGLLIPLAMLFLFLRFVLIGLFFKVSSKLTLGKLTTVLTTKYGENHKI